MSTSTAVVIGGTAGIGKAVSQFLAARGASVVLTGRTDDNARAVAAEVGFGAIGVAVDLSEPGSIKDALAGVGQVDHLVIAAIDRDANSVTSYDLVRASRLVTLKLVGYTEVVHTLLDRLNPASSVVMFGGLAMLRPYPGSTTVSTVNGGITGLVRALASELAPIRVNGIHPGIVGDSPTWVDKSNDAVRDRTPIGRLVTMVEIVHAVGFLLDNTGVNGINLNVDGGWLLK
jgi:NAD(P)-dependent dehydrogenase (short-subunit alcohol dehydrogenase family)